MVVIHLTEAVKDTCGGKAGALGALLRAGLPVPDGFVLPFDAYRAGMHSPSSPGHSPSLRDGAQRGVAHRQLPTGLLDAIARGLDALGNPLVAVRSSAVSEDTADASAAGQHESVLAVRGLEGVADAVRACWASLHSPRATGYRAALGHQSPADPVVMAVLVQRLVDAEVSGVMFTPTSPHGATRIEASWGLGPSVVEGTVTPDAYWVTQDGAVTRTISDKRTRLDRDGSRLVTSEVPAVDRGRSTLDESTITRLARLGHEITTVLGGPQDIEWAITDDQIWILQARPITAAPPPAPAGTSSASPATLKGTPGSHGTATGTARIIRGPGDFGRVRPGDILICPHTDPAWTPLLRIAAGVVTETGGVLSHAAIIARELRIPAVLGLPDATTLLRDDLPVTIDGTGGTVTPG